MSNRRRFTIIVAVADRNLFAPWFKNKASWTAWFAFLRALFALPMTAEQLAIYQQCTGRSRRRQHRQQKAGWSADADRGKVSS
jgi:hypothetical protein